VESLNVSNAAAIALYAVAARWFIGGGVGPCRLFCAQKRGGRRECVRGERRACASTSLSVNGRWYAWLWSLPSVLP